MWSWIIGRCRRTHRSRPGPVGRDREPRRWPRKSAPGLHGGVRSDAPLRNSPETPPEGESPGELMHAARSEPRPPEAYVVRCMCDPSEDGSGGETVVDHIRLFPIRPDVGWT